MGLYHDVERILISKERIAQAVGELGERITKDYAGKDLLLVCILKGSVVFFGDLIRRIDLPLSIDFMRYASYHGGTEPNGSSGLIQDLSCSIENRHVIIVEDIVDTGKTLRELITMLELRHPLSVEVAALLNKTGKRESGVRVRYSCFELKDEFVVGYGMDYGEKELYRNLPDICTLKGIE